MRTDRAFTLIELLVVVTIIVLLLALLTPALDRAIRQAEMAICAANLHAVAMGAMTYSHDNRRFYPTRIDPWSPSFYLRAGANDRDRMPKLRPYLSINKSLNCPLNVEVDFTGSRPDTFVLADYNLWFGFAYQTNPGQIGGSAQWGAGMYKVGDRFGWAGDSFDVLAGDHDKVGNNSIDNEVSSSHPDEGGVLAEEVFQDRNSGVNYTISWWRMLRTQERGLIDTNQIFQDMAVRRYESLRWDEPDHPDGRTARVPYDADSRNPALFFLVPLK